MEKKEEALIIMSSILMIAADHGCKIEFSTSEKIVKRLEAWLDDNFGTENYEVKKERFIFEMINGLER